MGQLLGIKLYFKREKIHIQILNWNYCSQHKLFPIVNQIIFFHIFLKLFYLYNWIFLSQELLLFSNWKSSTAHPVPLQIKRKFGSYGHDSITDSSYYLNDIQEDEDTRTCNPAFCRSSSTSQYILIAYIIICFLEIKVMSF